MAFFLRLLRGLTTTIIFVMVVALAGARAQELPIPPFGRYLVALFCGVFFAGYFWWYIPRFMRWIINRPDALWRKIVSGYQWCETNWYIISIRGSMIGILILALLIFVIVGR